MTLVSVDAFRFVFLTSKLLVCKLWLGSMWLDLALAARDQSPCSLSRRSICLLCLGSQIRMTSQHEKLPPLVERLLDLVELLSIRLGGTPPVTRLRHSINMAKGMSACP
jgi:hypothetical protein